MVAAAIIATGTASRIFFLLAAAAAHSVALVEALPTLLGVTICPGSPSSAARGVSAPLVAVALLHVATAATAVHPSLVLLHPAVLVVAASLSVTCIAAGGVLLSIYIVATFCVLLLPVVITALAAHLASTATDSTAP